MDYPITNQTIKVLKFIQTNKDCPFEKIKSKFPDIEPMDLVLLTLTNYVLCIRSGKTPTQFHDGNFSVSDSDQFWATPNTTKLLEDRQREWLQWVIPNVISGIALILSIIALLLSQLPQVTTVQIIP